MEAADEAELEAKGVIDTEDMLSCILRLRDLVMGPILVMDTPEAVVVVVTAEAVEAT